MNREQSTYFLTIYSIVPIRFRRKLLPGMFISVSMESDSLQRAFVLILRELGISPFLATTEKTIYVVDDNELTNMDRIERIAVCVAGLANWEAPIITYDEPREVDPEFNPQMHGFQPIEDNELEEDEFPDPPVLVRQ